MSWDLPYLQRCEMSLSNAAKWIQSAVRELPGCLDEAELMSLGTDVQMVRDKARGIINRVEGDAAA